MKSCSLEIKKRLIENGCSSDDWNTVYCQSDLDTDLFHQVTFLGNVFLKQIEKGVVTLVTPSGRSIERKSHISNSILKNVQLSGQLVISMSRIEGGNIAGPVIIENCSDIYTPPQPTFGVGTVCNPCNESGARSVLLHPQWNAHTACLLILKKSNKTISLQLEKKVCDKVIHSFNDENHYSISPHCFLNNCGEIENVRIGSGAVLNGVGTLRNGYIADFGEDLTHLQSSRVEVGNEVCADGFVFCRGSHITNASIIKQSFIGEAVHIGEAASITHSFIFENSEIFHSEVCSILAGPFTVTHHRATLLIAGYFSFYNAGSGTNSSNHMYKTGPVHDYILPRGCKTGSSSYTLSPSVVAPFTTIIGTHRKNIETSLFPFSLLLEKNGESLLFPGYLINNSGLLRDSYKWPSRDRRNFPEPTSHIHTEVFSPYTMGRVESALELLLKSDGKLLLGGVAISEGAKKNGTTYYKEALEWYVLDKVVRAIAKNKMPPSLQIFLNNAIHHGEWEDFGGLLIPKNYLINLISDLNTEILSAQQFHSKCIHAYNEYSNWELEWVLHRFTKATGFPLDIIATHPSELVDRWLKIYFDKLQRYLSDASTDYDEKSMNSFDFLGNKKENFLLSRGSLDSGTVGTLCKNIEKEIIEIAADIK